MIYNKSITLAKGLRYYYNISFISKDMLIYF